MNSDPTLAASAEHIRQAILELEETRRIAWQVFQEEQDAIAAQPERRRRRARKSRKQEAQDAADWLRALPPASLLKQ